MGHYLLMAVICSPTTSAPLNYLAECYIMNLLIIIDKIMSVM